MIDERDSDTRKKQVNQNDPNDTKKASPKAKSTISEYNGPLGPEIWSKFQAQIGSPDFVRADFYFFKVKWTGQGGTYPNIDAKTLSIILKRIGALAGISDTDEYAIFYRLCRPTLDDQIKLEILGVVPFFPINPSTAISLLEPLDHRELFLIRYLCSEWAEISRKKNRTSTRSFDVPIGPPTKATWPLCWPGDNRFSDQFNQTGFDNLRGTFWSA